MNDEKNWYSRFNSNEKRIIQFFIDMKSPYLVCRPVLEREFCKTGIMNQKTLTCRLNYLVDKGILGKVVGTKGAVAYAPAFLIKEILSDPLKKLAIDRTMNSIPPKSPAYITVVKPSTERISNAEMTGFLIRAAETCERFVIAPPKEKEALYRELRRRRRQIIRMERAREDESHNEVKDLS